MFRFITLALIFASINVSATVFTAAVSQDSMSLGDRILFNVAILIPKGSNIVPPSTENGFGKFIVKEWNTNKVEKNNTDSITFNYVLTNYAMEQCTIPPVPFVQVTGDKHDTLLSNSIPIKLVLVKNPDSSTSTIAGLKPQQSAGKPSLEWIWILMAVIAAAVLVYILRNRFMKKHEQPAAKPLLPPYEEALESIAALDSKQYIMKGMIKEYVFGLSDILKRYIERRFGVNSSEFTTEEMLEWIKKSPLAQDQKKICEWFFSTSDPVKFAKWLPDGDTVTKFGDDARKFLELTRPVAQTITSAEKTNAA
jgi:hypothetical protein